MSEGRQITSYKARSHLIPILELMALKGLITLGSGQPNHLNFITEVQGWFSTSFHDMGAVSSWSTEVICALRASTYLNILRHLWYWWLEAKVDESYNASWKRLFSRRFQLLNVYAISRCPMALVMYTDMQTYFWRCKNSHQEEYIQHRHLISSGVTDMHMSGCGKLWPPISTSRDIWLHSTLNGRTMAKLMTSPTGILSVASLTSTWWD